MFSVTFDKASSSQSAETMVETMVTFLKEMHFLHIPHSFLLWKAIGHSPCQQMRGQMETHKASRLTGHISKRPALVPVAQLPPKSILYDFYSFSFIFSLFLPVQREDFNEADYIHACMCMCTLCTIHLYIFMSHCFILSFLLQISPLASLFHSLPFISTFFFITKRWHCPSGTGQVFMDYCMVHSTQG